MLRSNYTFSEYSTDELREEARRHERFEEWTREELEEDYEQLEKTEANVEKYKNIRWILIAVLCAFLGYYYGSMNTKLEYLEQRTEQLQQELTVMEQENNLLEDKVDTLSDIIDLIIIYIASDNVAPGENPGTSAQII